MGQAGNKVNTETDLARRISEGGSLKADLDDGSRPHSTVAWSTSVTSGSLENNRTGWLLCDESGCDGVGVVEVVAWGMECPWWWWENSLVGRRIDVL